VGSNPTPGITGAAAAALLAARRRELRVPLALGFGAVALAAGVAIGLPTLRDDVVDESVAGAS
jgi:hypothetical protein